MTDYTPTDRTAYNRAYYAKNRERLLAQKREYHAKHKDTINAESRKHNAENRDKMREYERRYRAKNPDKVLAKSRKRYAENPDKDREYKRQYYAKNRDKINDRERKYYFQDLEKSRKQKKVSLHRYRARKVSLSDTFTAEDWQKCLDYFKGYCAACGQPPGLFNPLSMDHFVPLTAENCIGTVPRNIIPLCKSCNCSKQDKDALEWAVEKFGKSKGKKIVKEILAYFDAISVEGG